MCGILTQSAQAADCGACRTQGCNKEKVLIRHMPAAGEASGRAQGVRTKNRCLGACPGGVEYQIELVAYPGDWCRVFAFALSSPGGYRHAPAGSVSAAYNAMIRTSRTARKQHGYIACMKQKHQAPEFAEVSNMVICVSRFSSLNWRCAGSEATQSCDSREFQRVRGYRDQITSSSLLKPSMACKRTDSSLAAAKGLVLIFQKQT